MSEEELFESTFSGYKALLHDKQQSAITGKYERKPSNMFRVWLHLRAEQGKLLARNAMLEGCLARLSVLYESELVTVMELLQKLDKPIKGETK